MSSAAASEHSDAPPSADRVQVLVVDDSRTLGALARLLAGGHSAAEAVSGAGPPPGASERRCQHDAALPRITPREREVLALMAQGRSNAGIAAALVLSHSAVAKHINSIFTKLDIPPADGDNRRVLAVLKYLSASGAVARARS